MASLPAADRPLSAKSGRVKAARRLARRSFRAEHRLFLAEGSKALTEALLLPDCVMEVFATEDAGRTHQALQHAVDGAGIPWYTVTDEALGALAGSVTPQGIVSVCRFLDVSLETLLGPSTGSGTEGASGPSTLRQAHDDAGPEAGQLVVCAEVRDPGNAGTIIRTADAVGASGVVLAGSSVDPYNDKTVRATVGSLFHLPLVVEPDPAAVARRLQADGWTVLAADGAGELDLFDARRDGTLSGRVAWLFGNEAHGLPPGLGTLADHRVAIPIHGRAESLNLSTAAAVCLYTTLSGSLRP